MGKCVRPGRHGETSLLRVVQQTGEEGVAIPAKAQKENIVPGDSDVRCLGSRDLGDTLDSDPKMRVSQGAQERRRKIQRKIKALCTPRN